ncbi:UNVERIFIED_CONTAM: hypothetical protein FKN15_001278 [Acipenser sinensis]
MYCGLSCRNEAGISSGDTKGDDCITVVDSSRNEVGISSGDTKGDDCITVVDSSRNEVGISSGDTKGDDCITVVDSSRCFSALMSSKNKCRGEAKKLLQRRVKDAVSASAVMFSGYSEHDAQEFLNHCLVQLKEDGEKLVMAGEELQAGSPGISLSMYSCPVSTNMDFQLQYKMTCTGNPGNMHSCQLSEPLEENRPEKGVEEQELEEEEEELLRISVALSLQGHYISDVYDFLTDKWLTYNDEKVSETDESAVQAERKCTGYIFFYMHNCWSYLGVNGGPQALSLQSLGCMWSEIASHELMHTLGFVHEQSEIDRDKYITILLENVLKDHEFNFDKYKANNLNTPYDYGSLIHFGKGYQRINKSLKSQQEYKRVESVQFQSTSVGVTPVWNYKMNSTMIFILLGLAAETGTLPLQKNSALNEEAMRFKRAFSVTSNPAGLTFTEGDIAVSNKRSAITCSGNSCLWPKSVDGFVYVPYIISPEYNNRDRITIEIGMQDISTGTCIKFVPRTHQADYLDIQPRFGCWSYLGVNGGPQALSLQSPGCMWSGIASHVLMHALGFVHEQSRSDRDNYVTILWDNILKGCCFT